MDDGNGYKVERALLRHHMGHSMRLIAASGIPSDAPSAFYLETIARDLLVFAREFRALEEGRERYESNQQ